MALEYSLVMPTAGLATSPHRRPIAQEVMALICGLLLLSVVARHCPKELASKLLIGDRRWRNLNTWGETIDEVDFLKRLWAGGG